MDTSNDAKLTVQSIGVCGYIYIASSIIYGPIIASVAERKGVGSHCSGGCYFGCAVLCSVVFRLPFHSYLREVADDGSVVGRVEIGIVVVDEPIGLRSHFFWSSGCNEVSLLYEQAAFKAIRYPVILPGGGDTARPFYADREPLIDDKPVIFRYTGYVDPSARPLRRSFSQQRTHALCVSLVCSITVKEHVSCDEYQ